MTCQHGREPRSRRENLNTLRIPPPILAALYLSAALGLHFLFPGTRITPPRYRLLGIAILGTGIFLTGWAFRVFQKKGTTHNPYGTPTAVVASGPFRFGRNPMYLGVSLVLLGVAIFVGTVPLFFAPLAFFLTMNAVFIPREEKTLERIFGQEYLDYKHRVKRWL
jgi:protein-S-isoprenylcysteine O-methyltransferase Ste14